MLILDLFHLMLVVVLLLLLLLLLLLAVVVLMLVLTVVVLVVLAVVVVVLVLERGIPLFLQRLGGGFVIVGFVSVRREIDFGANAFDWFIRVGRKS